ncbi:MAG: repeat protein, partial [Pedosphaera sp.]|nr:repeat protein [Pedosphaera sp.]
MTGTYHTTARTVGLLLAGWLLIPMAGSLIAAPILQLGFEEPSSVNESNRSVVLTWNGEAGSVYKLQSSSNLASGAAWITEEPVLARDGLPIRWSAPEVLRDARFYRLLQEPEISGIEPGMISTDGGTVYLLGHSLSTNGTVRIGGLVIPPNVLQPGSVYSCVVPPLSAGTYDVEWLVSGQVAAVAYKLFSVTGQPTPVGETANLFEPPSPPFAQPALMKAKEKANQVKMFEPPTPPLTPALMKAKEKANRTKCANNLRTIGNPKPGGIKLFDGSNNGIQAGKKGLNAVNVKLARMASSWGGYDDSDSLAISWGGFDDVDTAAMSWAGNDDSDPDLSVAKLACGSDLCTLQLCSGEVQVESVDMCIPGRGLDFILARTYRSRSAARPGMSYSWTLSCDVSVAQTSDGIAVYDGTGRQDVYFAGTNGVYSRNEFFNEGRLLKGVFTLTLPDTGRWEFNPMDGSASAGKLARSVDRNGNRMLYLYGGSGQLAQVVDDLDRTNQFTYNSAGQLEAVRDFSGRTVTYHYYAAGETGGSPGDLKSVTTPVVIGTPNGNDFPDGKTTTYKYSSGFPVSADRENHLLLSIIDPKGQTNHSFVYQHNQTDLEFLRCVSATDGAGSLAGVSTIKYVPQTPSRQNGFAIVRAIVRDGVGNVTEGFYDSRNRCVTQRDFTGRALLTAATTDTNNRPTGQIRASDPAFYETSWTWNLDSLCTQASYPGGDATVCIYERDFNKSANPRKKGDLRICRQQACCGGTDTDGDGVADTTELTTWFQYDPRFGAPAKFAVQPKDAVVKDRIDMFRKAGGNVGINEPIPDTALGMRTRLNELENKLQNIGLLGRAAGGGTIRWTGTDFEGAMATRGWEKVDNTESGLSRPATSQAMLLSCEFATAVTDPRGNVTTCEYDAQGNCTRAARDNHLQGGVDVITALDLVYDNHGQLTTITNAADGNGYRRETEFNYYTSGPMAGYLSQIVDDRHLLGLRITSSFEYDLRGNLTRYVDPRTNDWLFTFNALDQCLQAQSPSYGGGGGGAGGSRVMVSRYCDHNHNVTRCERENRDANGALDPVNPLWTTLYEYDARDRCTAIVKEISETSAGASYATNGFDYDAIGELTEHRSPLAVAGTEPNNRATYAYDERGLLYRQTNAPGSTDELVVQLNYTPNALAKSVQWEPHKSPGLDSPVIEFTYDGFSRPATMTDAMSNVTTCAYDRAGNLVYLRCDGQTNDVAGSTGNRRLLETRCRYDALNRPVQCVGSFFNIATQLPLSDGAAVTTFGYAPNGQLLSVTDDNSHTTACTYDTAGRLAGTTDARGNYTITVRDAFGNPRFCNSIELPDTAGVEQVFTRTCEYDALNRLVSGADNVGNTNRHFYDSRGNVVRETDARGNDTCSTYDGLGRCVDTLSYVGSCDAGITINTSHVEYSNNSRPVSSTDGNNNITHYGYDARNRCTGITNADSTTHKLVWSPRSNLVGEQDANGTVISNSFDLSNRIVHRDIAAKTGVATTTTFETFAYDGLSRCVLASNDGSQVACAYDSLGNCVSGAQDGIPQSATYDAVGNCRSLTYPSGGVVTYDYDELDRITNVATAGGGSAPHPHLAMFGYDGPAKLSRITRDNNVGTRIVWDGAANLLNGKGDFGWQQVSRVNHQLAGNGGAVIDRRVFTYDRGQNKTTRAQTDPFRVGQLTLTNSWDYTALGQLSKAINTKGSGATLRTYNLDGEGNRLSVIDNGVVESYARDATLPAPADFQMNQYTMTPFGLQTYDDNGNLIARHSASQQLEHVYDYADRLVAVNDFTTGLSLPVVSFTYDALGARISKTV